MDVSSRMQRVRRKDTEPEMRLRRALWRQGLRYRLHVRGLPGSPDIVFKSCRVAIFVHGCFWHRHVGCRLATVPKSNRDFWERKFLANQERDERKRLELQGLGWRVVVVWQCETEDHASLKRLADSIKRLVGEAVPRFGRR